MGDEYVQVTTTTDSAGRAAELARAIVGAHPGACVQIIGPIRSVYRWHGVVHVDEEWRCQIRATAPQLDALTGHIRSSHNNCRKGQLADS